MKTLNTFLFVAMILCSYFVMVQNVHLKTSGDPKCNDKAYKNKSALSNGSKCCVAKECTSGRCKQMSIGDVNSGICTKP